VQKYTARPLAAIRAEVNADPGAAVRTVTATRLRWFKNPGGASVGSSLISRTGSTSPESGPVLLLGATANSIIFPSAVTDREPTDWPGIGSQLQCWDGAPSVCTTPSWPGSISGSGTRMQTVDV
jgi:hypothetical protein